MINDRELGIPEESMPARRSLGEGGRFAVVEYSSKSGTVWHHTPGHPNYLADPQKEIDPTSFGSYVSAFGGEHIPLKGIITGPVSQTWPAQKTAYKIYKRLTGNWPFWYPLNYFQSFDVLLVVHQLSDAHEMMVFIRRLKRRYPHIFLVGVPTQPYGLLRPHLEHYPVAKQAFIDFMNGCDLFLTVVADTKGWYESLTTTPIEYLPQIYPTHYASQFFKARTQKEKTIFVAGVTDREDIARGQLVAKELQKEFPEYLIYVTDVPGLTLDVSNLAGTTFQRRPFEQWREHLQTLGKEMVVVNTDFTLTRGRVQVDSAAVGTPAIGSNSDGQRDLFPELAATPATTVPELVTLGRRLIADEAYYDQVVDYAAHRLKKYDFEESVARLSILVKQYQA